MRDHELIAYNRRQKAKAKTPKPHPNKLKTHCVNGHEYTPENTIIQDWGSRRCRTCDRMRCRKQRKVDHAPQP